MGIASMVLGIISIVFSMFCAFISIVTAPIGLILGIIDLVIKSSKRNELIGEVKKEQKAMAIVGIVMCSIAILISIIYFLSTAVLFNDINRYLNEEYNPMYMDMYIY